MKKKNSRNFFGVITALITPFKKGKVDFKSLKRLLRQQMDAGVQGFVVNGTTGESPVLTPEEVEKIFRFVKDETDGAVPLILGTGSNSTARTIQNTQQARRLGADAALVVAPYYNKPPQRGLIAHFSAVAQKVNLPILLYNVPGRTVISISTETVLTLFKIKNIVGIKEASGQIQTIEELAAQGAGHSLLSGDDASCIDFMLAGGYGVISVVSHVIPRDLRLFSEQARMKNGEAAVNYKRFAQLNDLLSLEANPIPVKMMLYLMGIIDSPELRLPLLELAGKNKNTVMHELKNLGII